MLSIINHNNSSSNIMSISLMFFLQFNLHSYKYLIGNNNTGIVLGNNLKLCCELFQILLCLVQDIDLKYLSINGCGTSKFLAESGDLE